MRGSSALVYECKGPIKLFEERKATSQKDQGRGTGGGRFTAFKKRDDGQMSDESRTDQRQNQNAEGGISRARRIENGIHLDIMEHACTDYEVPDGDPRRTAAACQVDPSRAVSSIAGQSWCCD